jgi:hypothetical protein
MLADDIVGGHVAVLTKWLQREEGRVVQFVRQPITGVSLPRPLREVLLEDCLITGCLEGNLTPTCNTPEALLLATIRAAVSPMSRSILGVSSSFGRVTIHEHTETWETLRDAACGKDAVDTRRHFLRVLNVSQGDVGSAEGSESGFRAKFLDAAAVLPLVTNSTVPAWEIAARLHQMLRERFSGIVRAEQTWVRESLEKIAACKGTVTTRAVFDSMYQLILALQRDKISQSEFRWNEEYSSQALDRVVSDLSGIAGLTMVRELAPELSARGSATQQLRKYLDYFDRFMAMTRTVESGLKQSSGTPNASSELSLLKETVDGLYASIEQALSQITLVGIQEEAVS